MTVRPIPIRPASRTAENFAPGTAPSSATGGVLHGEPLTDAPAPRMGPLRDTFGRIADDLRISVTDRCNFRCTYCMPAEGLPWLPKGDILTFEEIAALLGVFVELGVTGIKLTGGEPTVRHDFVRLVRMLREAAPGIEISMTTNGFLLDKLAVPLKKAGLDRVTVSCDSLLRHRFQEMTRRDALDRVFAGIEAADRAGLTPLKINCVVIAGTNDDEVTEFARYSRATGHEVRFIEYMPLDAEQSWERAKVMPSAEILRRIDAAYPVKPLQRGAEPATSYRFQDGSPGGVGVIGSVTEPFCDTCNRLRLTADGHLRVCLFALGETDLRQLLREGATGGEIADAIRTAVWGKWAGHKINHADFERPAWSMSMIGG
jgi:cyclic pyranopterin phosphate synthase